MELEETRISLPRPLTVADMSYSPQGDKILCLVQGLPSWSVGEIGAEVVGELGLVSVENRRFDFLPVGGDARACAWRRSGKAVLFFRWDEWDKGAFLYEVDLAGSYHRLFSDEKSAASEEHEIPSSMAVTPDDTYAVFTRTVVDKTGQRKRVLWAMDMVSGKGHAVTTIAEYEPTDIATHPSEARQVAYATARAQQFVVAISITDDGRQHIVDRIPDAWVDSLAWRPDGAALAYWVSILRADGGTDHGELRIWDADTGKISVVPRSEELTHNVTAIAWAPDGEHLACAYTGDTHESAQPTQTELRFFRLQTE